MPSKKHKPEEIIGKLREAEIVLAQGGTTAEGGVSRMRTRLWRTQRAQPDASVRP